MKKKFKNKKFLLSIVLLAFLLGLVSFIFAAELDTEWPPAPGGKNLTGTSTLVDFVDYVYQWGIIIGGLAAFIALILAGFKYLTSVGDPSKMTDAKERIIAALAGLILLLSTFIILKAINPDLTSLQAPTTTIGGYGISTIGTGLSNKPCSALKIYSGSNYAPDNNTNNNYLVAAYFEEIDNDQWEPVGNYKICPSGEEAGKTCTAKITINECVNLGNTGWAFTGWFANDIPIGSIKIDGACVLNFYKENGCVGSEGMTISMSDPNFKAYSSANYHSVKLADRSGPSAPKVSNVSSAGIGKDSSGKTCQATLSGQLTEMGNNDYIRLYFIYGDSPYNLSYTWPPFETVDDPSWANYSQPLPILGDDSWKKVQQGELPVPKNYSYKVTTLATGTEYYWTAKGVAQGGGLFDIATSIASFTTPNVCP